MKKIIRKIKTLNYKIWETKRAIEVTKDSPFFTNFSSENQREKELNELSTRLKVLYSLKSAQLDNLIIAINGEKCDISKMERQLFLNQAV